MDSEPQPHSFKLSFTSVALGLREAELIIPLYLESKDWEDVAEVVVSANLLQKTSVNSSRRVFREIRQRLSGLSDATLEIFEVSGTEDRKAILFIAACKCYKLLYDFITQVLLDKVVIYDLHLQPEEFDQFWNKQTLEYEDLEDIAESTRKKIRQVAFRILAEAGLVSSTLDARITPIHISMRISDVLQLEGNYLRNIFLIN